MKIKLKINNQSLNDNWTLFGRYCLLVVVTFLAGQVLSQQSYTFTNAGASGNLGPTQGQINVAYLSTNLNGSVTIVSPGIQEWVVPATGQYAIDAYGGQGYGASGNGGRGAHMRGEFLLTAGQVLRILVGQQGELPASVSYNAQYGGGGGSFVTDNANNPLVVAGGGGGNWSSGFSLISDAPVTTAGNSGGGTGSTFGAGGTGGSGGGTSSSADGGAGFNGNGMGTAGGIAFLNGGNGGYTTSGIGGFGGGGGTSSFNNRRGGGGGGYSGGGGAEGVTTGFPEAGGGGSFNAGTNQINTAGVNLGHGKVVITKLCNVTISAVNNPICIGDNVILNTNAVTTLTWSSIGASGASSISVSPSVTASFYVIGVAATGCTATAALEVTVRPLPSVSAVCIPTILCVGKLATLTAFGANSYTWSSNASGTAVAVSPAVSTVYTFTGTSAVTGCKNSGTVAVNVNTNTVTILGNNTTCSGALLTLSGSGAVTYTWNTGSPFPSITVNPVTNTTYSISATDVNDCIITSSKSITVNPLPVVAITADKLVVCRNEPVNLTASGADSYSWSNASSGSSITVSMPIDLAYTYSVTGTSSNGCTNSAFVTITVSKCVGINENSSNNLVTTVFPNPTNGKVSLQFVDASVKTLEVVDLSGRQIVSKTLADQFYEMDLTAFDAGVYYLKVSDGKMWSINKIVKQ